jgi:hypothetical protein
MFPEEPISSFYCKNWTKLFIPIKFLPSHYLKVKFLYHFIFEHHLADFRDPETESLKN